MIRVAKVSANMRIPFRVFLHFLKTETHQTKEFFVILALIPWARIIGGLQSVRVSSWPLQGCLSEGEGIPTERYVANGVVEIVHDFNAQAVKAVLDMRVGAGRERP